MVCTTLPLQLSIIEETELLLRVSFQVFWTTRSFPVWLSTEQWTSRKQYNQMSNSTRWWRRLRGNWVYKLTKYLMLRAKRLKLRGVWRLKESGVRIRGATLLICREWHLEMQIIWVTNITLAWSDRSWSIHTWETNPLTMPRKWWSKQINFLRKKKTKGSQRSKRARSIRMNKRKSIKN